MNEVDPRVKRTRKLLHEAFGELLAEKRFADISVQDIAERATVNRATFYAHYVDKYALLDEALAERFRQTVTDKVSPNAPFTVEHLRVLIVAVLESLAQFQGHCHHQAPVLPPQASGSDLSPMLEIKMQQELEAFLQGWLQRATRLNGKPPYTLDAVASALSWAIFGAGMEWSRGSHTVTTTERARQVIDAFTGGVAHLVDESHT